MIYDDIKQYNPQHPNDTKTNKKIKVYIYCPMKILIHCKKKIECRPYHKNTLLHRHTNHPLYHNNSDTN